MYQEATEPQTIGGVLDKGFGLFRACLAGTFPLAVVAALLGAPLNRVGPEIIASSEPGSIVLGVAAWVVVMSVVSLVIYGGIIVRIAASSRGETVALRDALAIGLRRAVWMFLAAVCYALIVGVGFLLIVPGLWLTVALMFAFFTVILDGRGPIESLKYSYALVRGHWWRTTGLLTVILFVVIVIYFVVGIIAGIAAAFNPELLVNGTMPWYVDFIVVPLLTGLVYPLMYALLYAVYRDLQIRHEGGDLAARIAAASQ